MVNMLNGWKAPSFAGSNKSSSEDITNPASILSKAALLRDGDSGSSPREQQQLCVSEEDLRRQYQYTPSLQDKFQRLRDKDFARLDEQNCIYLDYTGAALAPKRLVEEHAQMLQRTILGNPHSQNAPSLAATQLDTEARRSVLEFFHAPHDNYEVIWTANASAALRVVGESYPFASSSSHDDDYAAAFLYAPDCHNSVNGIFQYATRHQARTGGFRFRHDHSLNYDWSSFVQQIAAMDHHRKGSSNHNSNNSNNENKLLALPGESNASGLTHNVRRYVDYAHTHGWDVLVDAAAMAPTNPIDLQALGLPEFVTVSFYKIFGYPTGIGCLLAKRSALRKLHKPWFSGGTVRYVGLSSHTIVPLEYEPGHHEQYEDGTINFQATGAVTAGLRYMREEVGMEDLERHVGFLSALTEWKLRELTWDRSAGGGGGGAPLVYIPPNPNDDGDDQAGTRAAGGLFDPERRAPAPQDRRTNPLS